MSAKRSTKTSTKTVSAKAAGPVDGPFAEQCQAAVALLDRLLETSPYPSFQELDMTERAIVRLRDGLIERLRQDNASAEAPRLRALLERANIAISAVVGVEYPAAGVRRELLEMARDALKGALAAE
jgi:hypothetical protein